MSELGSLLKKARETQGKTLPTVKNDTRIQESFLTAIEEGNYDELPSYLHAYGFVKKYAEYLGFNYEDIQPQFDNECPKPGVPTREEQVNKTKPRQLVVTPPKTTTTVEKKKISGGNEKDKIVDEILAEKKEEIKTDDKKQISAKSSYNAGKNGAKNKAEKSANVSNKKGVPITGIIVGGIIILALALIFSNVYKDKATAPIAEIDVTYNNAAENVEDDNMTTAGAVPPAGSLGAMLASDNMTLEADNITDNVTISDNITKEEPVLMTTPIEPAIIQPSLITLSFTEECWIKYTPDNKTSEEFTAQPGTSLPLKFDKTFVLDVGNAAALSMKHEGKTYSGFGRPGVVRKLAYELQNGSLVRMNE